MVSPSKQQNKKVLERRIKGSPGPSNPTASVSGSRRTKISSKPLANRRFYLDIKNHSSLKKLSDQLMLLGGKPELFLDKDVDYVVTDRENFNSKKRLPLDRTPTPSPLPSFCSVSPATTDSPTDGLGNKKTRSRAEAMLERVRQQPQKTTGDILDNATSWNIPVYPLPKFLAWLEKFNSKVEKSPNPASDSTKGLKILSGCYLKVEAGNLRPDFKQFPSWPSLPFSLADKPKPLAEKIVTTPKGKTENWSLNKTPRNELASNVPSNRMTRRVRRTKEASSAVGGGHGYCEICRTHYDQLDSHTASAQHLKIVADSSQYSQLDSIIQRNHLGSGNLRKSLRIAKSPPPASAPSQARMGGRHSLNGASASASGGGTNASGDRNLAETADMITTPVSREVARSLRLREYSVSIGPMVNGFGPAMPTKSKTSFPLNKLASPTQVVPPLLPSVQSVNVNGCTRRSQRSRNTSETSDKEAGDDVWAPPTTDRNLRSRKASSAQTPMTPPPPERLPSPPPVEKLSPPAVKSGSACERAVTRSDRCSRRSEDRNSRRSEDRISLRSEDRSSSDKDHRPASRLQEKERVSLRLKSPGLPPAAKVSVMTRSYREPSVDVEKTPRSPSPTKSVAESGPLQLKLRYRRLRCQDSKSNDDCSDSRTKRAKVDVNEDDRQSEGVDADDDLPLNNRLSPIVNKSDDFGDQQKTPRKRWQSDGDSGRKKKSKRKAADRSSSQENYSVNRDEVLENDDDDGEHPDDEDGTSGAANETPLDDWDATHDRIRTLRHKDRSHFYGELESEDSPPSIAQNSSSRTSKNSRKKSFASKPRVTKKRLSVEEKLIEDNKSYYKVEVLNSKLRSTEYFVSQRQAEERVNGDVEGIKPVVVRFKKIRTAELALLSDEAENFMFGEPKRETDSGEEDDGQLPDEEAEPRSKSGLSSDRLGSSSIKLETDSSQHSDLVAVKARSSCDFSSPLKIRIKQEPVESEGDEDVDVDPSTLNYLFEKPLSKEPWIEALKRQQEGTEHYIPMSHDYPKIILPYQIYPQSRPFRAIKNQNDSCASSDCSDFLSYLDDDHPSTKKRKKRRNLTGWPMEKPRKKFKDASSSGSCLLMNVRAPNTPEHADAPLASPLARTPSRGRGRGRGRGRPPKTSPRRVRPYVSATLPVPSTRTSASEQDGIPTSPQSAEVANLPPKKKLSRLSAARALNKF
ncbi:unnamed protein product [Nesidiocoris tenuis]|uniref:DBF4-type domain-containing protein n=1 Tax=Nesidiocoris tenuis TaxID=355587 RepID=A0A6H5H4Z8_9HEMI|nr:unnamed protein product [Nesidiocoris tenuis]